jgi:hypothetical protein
MEVLGFFDTPTQVVRGWGGPVAAPATAAGPTSPPSPTPPADPFDDWRPQVAADLWRRTRWGRIVTVVAVGAMLGVLAARLYLAPREHAMDARSELVVAAQELQPSVDALVSPSVALTSSDIDVLAVNELMLGLDAGVRRLFEAGAALAPSDGDVKLTVLQVSDSLAEAQRLFSDAYAYRSAVVPALVAPVLETDPGLVSLEQAAAAFATWQASFEAARDAMPQGVLPAVSLRIDDLSDRLAQMQSDYLDNLAAEDAQSAAAVVQELESSLAAIQAVLLDHLAEAQERIELVTNETREALDALPSLTG